jgi:hypothetical protein
MSKHTPGPWKVYEPDCGEKTFGIDAEEGFAVVWFGEARDEGIRRIEDACLIAAAPDLLEACIEVRVWMLGRYGAERQLAMLDAAIQKATGDQA